MLKRIAIVLAFGLAAGCSHIDYTAGEYKPVARENLKNAQGHVVGYKEVVRDAASGEEMTQIALFVPRVGERGQIIGYEERVRGGSVLRDLYGKKIGGRFVDLRSRGSNPQNKGFTIIVSSRQPDRVSVVAAAPTIDDLMRLARLDN
jgi:hypothetical protein